MVIGDNQQEGVALLMVPAVSVRSGRADLLHANWHRVGKPRPARMVTSASPDGLAGVEAARRNRATLVENTFERLPPVLGLPTSVALVARGNLRVMLVRRNRAVATADPGPCAWCLAPGWWRTVERWRNGAGNEVGGGSRAHSGQEEARCMRGKGTGFPKDSWSAAVDCPQALRGTESTPKPV